MTDNPRIISFTIPMVLDSLNVRQRKHWAVLQRDQANLAMEIMTALKGPRHYPRPPFERARITIVRRSNHQLDPDNLVASNKDLIDLLCVRSVQHPLGQGIIVDDSSKRIELICTQQRPTDKYRTTETVVTVEDLGPMPVVEKAKKTQRQRRPSTSQIARVEQARKPI